MVPQQKRAWFTLGAFAVAAAAVLALLPWLGIAACAASGLVGLSALAPLLFRKKGHPGEVAEDERDRMISRTATATAGMGSYTAMILACMIPWFVHMFQSKKTITIHALPWIVFTGMFVFIFGHAVMTLLSYGREVRHGEN
jgi:hypothetical protein